MMHPYLRPSCSLRTRAQRLGLWLASLLVAGTVQAAAAPTHAANPAFERTRRQAEQLVGQLRQRAPQLDATWNPAIAGPQLLTGLGLTPPGATAEQKALDFATRHAGLWGIHPEGLVVHQVVRSKMRTAVRFNFQMPSSAGPLVVLDRQLVVTFDAVGRLVSVSSDLLPFADQADSPLVPQQVASDVAARAALGLRPHDAVAAGTVQSARLAVWATPAETITVWAVDVRQPKTLLRRGVLVDARSGAVVAQVQPNQH
jgi:hypothetical protein